MIIFINKRNFNQNTHQTQKPKNNIKNLCFREQVLSKFDTSQGLQESNGPTEQNTYSCMLHYITTYQSVIYLFI